MFSQYFGNYLLNRELITKDQLVDALEFQQSVHVKFGVLAINAGYMTSSQVEEVHEKQKLVDKRFGEIAVELGHLTDDQLESLLTNQKQSHLYLAQALVDKGYMTIEQFGYALNEYKHESSLSDEQFELIKADNIELLVKTAIGTDDTLLSQYLSLFAKNMIRFIDDQTYLVVGQSEDNSVSGEWVVHQEITGAQPLYTALIANEEVFLHIASVYAEEELSVVDALAKASVSEFLNLHNGIYLVNMSNEGTELSMKPQEVLENRQVTGEIFNLTVNTSKGAFQLVLSKQLARISIETLDSQQLA